MRGQDFHSPYAERVRQETLLASSSVSRRDSVHGIPDRLLASSALTQRRGKSGGCRRGRTAVDHRFSARPAFIVPGLPWENRYTVSSNAGLRDEFLNGKIFYFGYPACNLTTAPFASDVQVVYVKFLVTCSPPQYPPGPTKHMRFIRTPCISPSVHSVPLPGPVCRRLPDR